MREATAKVEGNKVLDVARPARLTSPVIYASPHSGRSYPADLLKNSRLDRHALRQSEDGYVDLLFAGAPRFGSPLLRALFPRAFVDVNRARFELDQRMFADRLPEESDTRSTRVRAGLGVIPRIVADGHDIYARKLRFAEARKRLTSYYDPYHEALCGLIDDALDAFGCAVVIDCHSMPSAGVAPLNTSEPAVDFVLGDRYGVSCAPGLTAMVEQTLHGLGYGVVRNVPYAGGYVASAYGRPLDGVHVIQVEINRRLYLNEGKHARNAGFESLKTDIDALMENLARISPSSLNAALAAE